MMTFLGKTLCATLAVALLVWAPTPRVLAQEAEEAESEPAAQPPQQIEEIVVTARKREESLQRVPISITAFTADDLHNQSMEDMSELTWQTPNFELSNTPVSRTQAAMTMRGITVLDAAPTLESAVGIYLDGVYIHPLTTALFNFVDFERIEVLKGPQGTLFGRNTIGGAINLVTKKPDGQFGGVAKVTLGSYDRRDFNGALSFPILGEAVSARVAFLTTYHDHYSRDTFGRSDEQEDERINGGRASLRWVPSEDFEVVLAWDRLEDHSGVSSQKNIGVNRNDFIFVLANELHGPGGTNELAQFGVTNLGDLLDKHRCRGIRGDIYVECFT